MSSKFNLSKPIVIADSGLLTTKNILALEKDDYEYILGGRIKNESELTDVNYKPVASVYLLGYIH